MKNYILIALVLILLLGCSRQKQEQAEPSAAAASSAESSVEMKTLTDDAGRNVKVPVKPKAIAGGHDAIVTLPLYELGLPVIASLTRKDPATGETTVFGLKEIFGVTAKQAGIQNVAGYQDIDVEKVRALGVDLYIGTEGSEKTANKFKGVAPYFIQNSYSKVSGNANQKILAERFGAMDKWNELNDKYQKRLTEVKAKLPFDPSTKTYIGVIMFDKLSVGNSIGGVNQAMEDLGFQKADWLTGEKNLGFMVPVAPEEIEKIDQDIVFMMAGYSFPDRSPANTRKLVRAYAPGWEKFLKAATENRIIFVDSMFTVTPTFASNMYILDQLEQYYKRVS